MIRGITAGMAQVLGMSALLAVFLFIVQIAETPSSLASFALRGISPILQDPISRGILLTCLALFFIALAILELKNCTPIKGWSPTPILLQSGFVSLALLAFALLPSTPVNSAGIEVILCGIIFAKVVSAWALRRSEHDVWRVIAFVTVLTLLVTSAVLCQPEARRFFYYHEQFRWSGPWDNPNLFGLLTGTAVVLSLSLGIRTAEFQLPRLAKLGTVAPHILITVICGYGLFKSFSRGAWLATAVGMTYVLSSYSRNPNPTPSKKLWKWFHKNRRSLALLIFAMVVLVFWQFRFTSWRPAQRVFSVVNVNDFSWRNRIVAWKGALRMMADQPGLGFGWGTAEAIYGKQYLPAQFENGAAVQTNDYFMLGISAGVPAMVCFLMYVSLSLRSSPILSSYVRHLDKGRLAGAAVSKFPVDNLKDLDWLQTTCRAGAVVLAVGFFFDGGLLKLATGSVFWILLELGRRDLSGSHDSISADVINVQEIGMHSNDPGHRWEICLRWTVWVVGIAAISSSAILIATPFFGVNRITLAISRHYLVPPSAAPDLRLLATNAVWHGKKLGPLLQHASLASYNRQLINWRAEERIYREFVLNPSVDPPRDGRLNWRRNLWEYFYLPVRKQNDPLISAHIVLQLLHDRTSIVANGPMSIEAMWKQKKADIHGLEALKVAAFRSVGIPARLNINCQAEIFADGKWQSPNKGAAQ